MKKSSVVTAAFALWLFFSPSAKADASPVLLSFDVEEAADVAALNKLRVPVPATYFITGSFARSNPEVVRALASRENTIGSHSDTHPHFTRLDQESIEREVTTSKQSLESISGKQVTWFRAPYLEYDNRLMQALKAAGFRGDSSDKEAWANQSTIFELPISNFIDASLIASDYDMIDEARYTNHRFRETLEKMYREKAQSGQPFVVLLHPRIVARETEAFREFIRWANRHEARFMSADSYVADIQKRQTKRHCVWIEPIRPERNPEQVVAEIAALGVTDAFIKATDAKGNRYFIGNAEDAFGRTVTLLRAQKIRVHAVMSVLADEKAAQQHPEWSMISRSGERSSAWISPSTPAVTEYLNSCLQELLRTYRLDGVCLENLAYPGTEFDYSPALFSAYAHDAKLKRVPKLSELMNADFTSWSTWHAQQIADLAGILKKTVNREGGGKIEVSAIVPAGLAINYRESEKRGQSVAMLGRNVDLLIADLPRSGSRDTNELQLFALRLQAGNRPVLVRLLENADRKSTTTESTTPVRELAHTGVDGIGILSDNDVTGLNEARELFRGAAH